MIALERPHRSASPWPDGLALRLVQSKIGGIPRGGVTAVIVRSRPRSRWCRPLSPDRCYVAGAGSRPRPRVAPCMSGDDGEWIDDMDCPRSIVHRVVMAVVSDDHNAEVGEAALREIVAGVGLLGGAAGLEDLAVELASKVAELVERIATEQGVAAVDLADILFLD